MRLSQRYADHSAELLSTVDYISVEAGTSSDDATRLGITAAEVTTIIGLQTSFETA